MGNKKAISTQNLPILFFDGASRGNPGEAAGAAVIVMPDGQHHVASKYMPFSTNNEAEYTGLIMGLKQAQALGIRQLTIRGDSNLVVQQVQGFWKVKKDRLRVLCQEAKTLIQSFDRTVIEWVRREENKLADAAANKCIDGTRKSPSTDKIKDKITSQPVKAKKDKPKSRIERLIELGNNAKFQDYVNLKSGRDEFTAKRLPGLEKLVSKEVKEAIAREWDGNDTYLAKVYRWCLRGLPPEMALRKIYTDAEMKEKATGKHPWKDKDKDKTEKKKKIASSGFAVGNRVLICNVFEPEPENIKEGIIVEKPKLSDNGKVLLSVELK